ncbi:hypothetical protein CKAN_02208400 [Cinnamomum micranthum f. kanehirae]|uniref:Uncharacterized protein n=1 Tax=Cinnamomum micranthum f. kanehirae TaxID=337451 RepID=A0A3S3PKS4_9MAGN|nr:hypothetical protein CKAN_02208400 [Cinnamomum micranthum f. kanehirae]
MKMEGLFCTGWPDGRDLRKIAIMVNLKRKGGGNLKVPVLCCMSNLPVNVDSCCETFVRAIHPETSHNTP